MRKLWLSLLCALCVLGIAVAGGSTAAASIQTSCSGALCVTVEDVDGVSPSVIGSPQVTAYQVYKVTVANTGSTALPAGTITVLLSDLVAGNSQNSNAEFFKAGSSPACARISQGPNTVRCAVGALAGGTSSSTFQIAYRTTRTSGATSTTAAITVALGSSSVSTSEQTDLESDPEAASAWSPPGSQVQLGTSPTFDTQFSTLQFKVPTNKPGFVSALAESSTTVCPPGLTCFGEGVTTDLSGAAAGTFSAANQFHLTLNISLSVVPPGAPLSNVFLWHRLDNGTLERVRTRCQPSPPTATSTLPCITVTVDTVGGRIIIDAWGFQNGGWVPGL
jgi:hypothetical protein